MVLGMGHTTDFVGHLDIEPALNRDEVEHLLAFARPGRGSGAEGVYVAPGTPEPFSPWVPHRHGSRFTVDGHEECDEPVAWLRYLVGHLLLPRAKASLSRLPQFGHFTFDHVLNGMVVGCRSDTGELFAITARGSRVSTKVLRAGESPCQDRPSRTTRYGDVIDLAARRARG
jgi:hypothetical protein